MRLWLLVLAFVLLPAIALAAPTSVTSSVDTNEIELGDMVTYTLLASGSDPAGEPKLAAPSGFTVVDSSASPSHMVSIVNGNATEKHELRVVWTLRADRLGTFTIGPGSVSVKGARREAASQRVTVVAPGAGRPRPKRRPPPRDPFGGSPFDPFKGLFGQADDDEPAGDPLGALDSDPKLALDAPRAPVAFLHATVDKTRAVLGEQVTLTVYLYEDLRQRQGRPSDVHEATATDFVKRSLLQDETRATHVGNAIIAGKPWSVKLVRKNALFPLKTGRLAIDPMSLTLPSVRVGLRESERLFVDVTEPPAGGRPPGYQPGDTGDFSLSATVTPQSVEQHGAIGVTVELRGTGNLPAALKTPEVSGVEWLEPQTRESLGPVSNERFGGTRTFSYVVRVHREGAVDLGELQLPFYDPQRRMYGVARAALGIVQVRPGTGRDAGAEVADTVLPNLPAARSALEGRPAQSFVTERPLFWAAIFGSPLACALALVATGAARRVRERRANAAPSPERVASQRRAEASAALAKSDGKAAIAAVARALEAEVLAQTGVNLRGTSRETALRELEEAGVKDPKEILAVAAACEDARFSPHDIAIEDARALDQRARAATKDL